MSPFNTTTNTSMATRAVNTFVSSDEEDNYSPSDNESVSSNSGSSNRGDSQDQSGYKDYLLVPAADVKAEFPPPKAKRKGPRGGVIVPFPVQLFKMLDGVKKEGLEHIVSWQPHGRCFVVRKPKEFASKIMPRYFRQSKYTSFQRQLNLYGFQRLWKGVDRKGYFHELFLRSRPEICKYMLRTRVKGQGDSDLFWTNPEPNLYQFPSAMPKDTSTPPSFDDKDDITMTEATVNADKEEIPKEEQGPMEEAIVAPMTLSNSDLLLKPAVQKQVESAMPTTPGMATLLDSIKMDLDLPLQVIPDPTAIKVERLSSSVHPLLGGSVNPLTERKRVPVDKRRRVSEDAGDSTCFFAGLQFQTLDEATLDNFESSLIPV